MNRKVSFKPQIVGLNAGIAEGGSQACQTLTGSD